MATKPTRNTTHCQIDMLTPTSKPRLYVNGQLIREYPDLAYLLVSLRNRMYGQAFTLELNGTFIQ